MSSYTKRQLKRLEDGKCVTCGIRARATNHRNGLLSIRCDNCKAQKSQQVKDRFVPKTGLRRQGSTVSYQVKKQRLDRGDCEDCGKCPRHINDTGKYRGQLSSLCLNCKTKKRGKYKSIKLRPVQRVAVSNANFKRHYNALQPVEQRAVSEIMAEHVRASKRIGVEIDWQRSLIEAIELVMTEGADNLEAEKQATRLAIRHSSHIKRYDQYSAGNEASI